MNPRFEMIPCSSGELPEKSDRYWVMVEIKHVVSTTTEMTSSYFERERNNTWHLEGYLNEITKVIGWLKPIPAPEPIPEGEGVTCQKCGNRYRVDLMVPDALWNQIKPEGKENGAGLLCGHCIISAMEAQGYGHLNCQGEAPTRITPQEAKDEVARKRGHISWQHLRNNCGAHYMEEVMNEVCELYASGSSPVQVEAMSQDENAGVEHHSRFRIKEG